MAETRSCELDARRRAKLHIRRRSLLAADEQPRHRRKGRAGHGKGRRLRHGHGLSSTKSEVPASERMRPTLRGAQLVSANLPHRRCHHLRYKLHMAGRHRHRGRRAHRHLHPLPPRLSPGSSHQTLIEAHEELGGRGSLLEETVSRRTPSVRHLGRTVLLVHRRHGDPAVDVEVDVVRPVRPERASCSTTATTTTITTITTTKTTTTTTTTSTIRP